MPNPTAQQLADIMQPLFERWPELRPRSLHFGKPYSAWFLHLRMNTSRNCDQIDTCLATQLCESSMVRWLAKERISIEIVLSEGWDVILAPDGIGYHGDTLVHALAAACTAVLDAEEEPA